MPDAKIRPQGWGKSMYDYQISSVQEIPEEMISAIQLLSQELEITFEEAEKVFNEIQEGGSHEN